MDDRPLPRPTSGTELYLAAVLDELKAINAQLIQPEPEPEQVDGDEIELKEPMPVYTSIPADFPGKDVLNGAGIIYLENVPRDGVELTAISGIGRATANRILTWFKT